MAYEIITQKDGTKAAQTGVASKQVLKDLLITKKEAKDFLKAKLDEVTAEIAEIKLAITGIDPTETNL